MKRLATLFALILAIFGVVGCSLPTRESINEAKSARDGVDRPVNERDSVDE